MTHSANSQRGAALIVGLVLLLVLTLLGVSGMNTSTVELRMAQNMQFTEEAFQAAEVGVERAMNIGGLNTGIPAVVDETPISANSNATLETNTAFVKATLPDPNLVGAMSFDKAQAYHFTVRSTGRSSRNAVSRHAQSFFMVGPNLAGD